MPVMEAQQLPEAAADVIDALAHLILFASASGHAEFAGVAMSSLESLLEAPEARQIIPGEYFECARVLGRAS